MILDGDQKVRRGVCAASWAGKIDMYGATQVIGCSETPMYGERFCENHRKYVKKGAPPQKKSKKMQTRSEFQRKIKALEQQLKPGEKNCKLRSFYRCF